LGNIFNLGVIAYKARQQSSELALIFFNQPLECLFVASLGAFDQFLVNFAFVHAL